MAATKKTKDELERKKSLAFTLYVNNGLLQKAISKITGISETSISKWKNDGNWDEERRLELLGPENQMRRIVKLYDAMLTQIEGRPSPKNVPDSKEADIMNKLADTAKKLRTEDTLFIRSQVGKTFVMYIQKVHGQDKAVEQVNYWNEFMMNK